MSANLRIKDLKMYGPKLTRLMGNATRAELSPSGGSLRRSEWLRNSKPSRLSFNAGCMIAWPRSVHGSGKVVLGYYQYHAVPGNTTQLRIFKLRVCRLWQSVLVRRSQRAKMRWERFTPVLNRWMPPPRVLHPYPDARFYATHPYPANGEGRNSECGIASVQRCFRGSYRQHAAKGFHGNKGDPSGSSVTS